jgi:hypothetical protein
MPRLKNRQHQIPGNLTFRQPESNWQPRANSSFQGIVEALIAHRRANPFLAQQHNWSTDRAVVEDEVDSFNASLCEQMGWTDYIMAAGGQPAQVPFERRPAQSILHRAASVVAGSETLVDWISSGAEAVKPSVSEERAVICSECPRNESGELLRWFTRPAAAAIKAAVESRKGMNLSTTMDDKLGVCSACGCELHLKVHLPLDRIKAHMSKETMEALDPRCWITKVSP